MARDTGSAETKRIEEELATAGPQSQAAIVGVLAGLELRDQDPDLLGVLGLCYGRGEHTGIVTSVLAVGYGEMVVMDPNPRSDVATIDVSPEVQETSRERVRSAIEWLAPVLDRMDNEISLCEEVETVAGCLHDILDEDARGRLEDALSVAREQFADALPDWATVDWLFTAGAALWCVAGGNTDRPRPAGQAVE